MIKSVTKKNFYPTISRWLRFPPQDFKEAKEERWGYFNKS